MLPCCWKQEPGRTRNRWRRLAKKEMAQRIGQLCWRRGIPSKRNLADFLALALIATDNTRHVPQVYTLGKHRVVCVYRVLQPAKLKHSA